MTRLFAIAIAFLITSTAVSVAQERVERYTGYYFPEVSSQEAFSRSIRSTHGAGKDVRIDFVNKLTVAQLSGTANPRFVFYAKGSDATTLILTGLDDDVFANIYRARAVLAQLTVSVRQSGFFKQQDLEYVATFLDLVQLLEFDELIITDGKGMTHQIDFLR